MKRVFIGHRGAGKTELLKRHQVYFPDQPHFDLDLEIEKSEHKKVSEIFQSQGEDFFRKVEIQIFQKLIQSEKFVISLGAGFNPQLIPNEIEVIYVSRRTDSEGRIFLNRPRLNSDLSALQEYVEYFKKREPRFRSRADIIYHLPEGHIHETSAEKDFFNKKYDLHNAYVTATRGKKIQENINVELRTDIFSTDEIQDFIENKKNKFLISYRKKTNSYPFLTGLIDWALELGAPPAELLNANLIISNHDDDIKNAIIQFEKYPSFHQKLCPIIESWDQLEMGHKWQSEDPLNRSFLPRTSAAEKKSAQKSTQKSKWRWYRQLQFSKQKINFVQGLQDFDDQPSLFEYLNTNSSSGFAAVLGDPIHHSKTPIIQGHHFHLNVLAIPVREDEFEKAISVLTDMGLVAAAVTSPLKNKAGKICGKKHAINSLVYKNNSWIGTSTDEVGLEKLIQQIPNFKSQKIVIWGGGGILNSIHQILPNAIFYSARTQAPRDENKKVDSPDVVIWASPRNDHIQMPPLSWSPQYVLDLNYAENSMGLEYAQGKNLKYISGEVMFFAQAEKQLQFWKENL